MKITAEIVVMYDDLKVVRVPWADRVSLRRDGVLFIVVSQPDLNPGPNYTLNGRRRQSIAFDEDFYMIYQKGDWYTLHAFSNDTFKWYSLSKPWGNDGWKQGKSLPPWMPEDGLYFTGAFIDDATWKKALKKFRKEMF